MQRTEVVRIQPPVHGGRKWSDHLWTDLTMDTTMMMMMTATAPPMIIRIWNRRVRWRIRGDERVKTHLHVLPPERRRLGK
jgi:hypothetical protein